MAVRRTSWMVWLRRASQTAFLFFFICLFFQTAYHPIDQIAGRVTLFFEIDPLVLLAVWLSSHMVVKTLLLSLITLAATVFFGRWFCGWLCPLGTIHNFFTCLRGAKHVDRMASGGYSSRQKVKYYVLVGFLAAAALGVNTVGWLDPFTFLYRSLATSIFPAANAVLQRLFTWLYHADPGLGRLRVTRISEPAYDLLRKSVLAVEQPYYTMALFIGFVFIGIAALNFVRARFWCRYVCPLGALLGFAGKNPLLRLSTDPKRCNDCRLCLVECQGGANPQGSEPWQPSECFYCWNCHSNCPSDAITFKFEIPEVKNR